MFAFISRIKNLVGITVRRDKSNSVPDRHSSADTVHTRRIKDACESCSLDKSFSSNSHGECVGVPNVLGHVILAISILSTAGLYLFRTFVDKAVLVSSILATAKMSACRIAGV